MRSELPPKKKNWKPGTVQVGLFYRTEEGEAVELISNKATPELAEATFNLIRYRGNPPKGKKDA